MPSVNSLSTHTDDLILETTPFLPFPFLLRRQLFHLLIFRRIPMYFLTPPLPNVTPITGVVPPSLLAASRQS